MSDGSWKFFNFSTRKDADVSWGKRDSQITWLILIGFLAVIGICYFTNLLPPPAAIYAFVTSIAGIGIRIVIYIWEKIKENPDNPKAPWIILLIVFCAIIVLVLALIYDIGFYTLFGESIIIQISWFTVLIYSCLAVLGLYNVYKAYVIKDKDYKEEMLYILAFTFTPLALIIWLVSGVQLGAAFPFWLLVVITGLVGIMVIYKSPKAARKRTTWTMGIFCLVLVVAIFFIINPYSLWASLANMHGPMVFAAVNPFSAVWSLFFEQATAPLMIAIMTFGAMVYIFASTFGDLISAGKAIGAVLMILPPMIIIMEIFAGVIALPPGNPLDILGPGVENFIYALGELGVFIVVMSMLLTFTGMVKALTK